MRPARKILGRIVPCVLPDATNASQPSVRYACLIAGSCARERGTQQVLETYPGRSSICSAHMGV